jgi:hypothetical protein
MDLTLRKTVLAGDELKETAERDYCVIHDGRSIGRIRLADERSWQGTAWVWNIGSVQGRLRAFLCEPDA